MRVERGRGRGARCGEATRACLTRRRLRNEDEADLTILVFAWRRIRLNLNQTALGPRPLRSCEKGGSLDAPEPRSLRRHPVVSYPTCEVKPAMWKEWKFSDFEETPSTD